MTVFVLELNAAAYTSVDHEAVATFWGLRGEALVQALAGSGYFAYLTLGGRVAMEDDERTVKHTFLDAEDAHAWLLSQSV